MFAEVAISSINKRWTVKENVLLGFTPEEMEKHRVSQRLLESVVNSWEFRQELLALELTSTAYMSNLQIYTLIMSGSEVLSPEVDNEADISIHAYFRIGTVIGYTYPSSEKTFVNLKFFRKFDYSSVASNLFHEWLHKLGFSHKSAKEKTSVPYALGTLIETLVKHLMNGGVLHDVHDSDKEIDRILLSKVPSTNIKKVLVCKRTAKTLFRKKCYYV